MPASLPTTALPVRLSALAQRPARLRVDPTHPGRIAGVSLITSGPAAGHGFDVDQTTVEQVAEFASGLRGRWTHGDLSSDGLGRHLGRWTAGRTETFWLCRACQAEVESLSCPTCQAVTTLEHRAVGDFVFDPSAHSIRPDGLAVAAPVYLMQRAKEDPQSLGISVVARFEFEEDPGFEGEEATRLARLPRRGDLLRGDWVADPAANPIGLHTGTGAPSELLEGARRALDRVVERLGHEEAKTRALAFLARYFGDRFEEVVPAEVAQVASPEALWARVDALTREVEALRTGALEPKATLANRVERVRRDAVALNAPVPAVDLQRLKVLVERGELETADTLAEVLLTRAELVGRPPFHRDGIFRLDGSSSGLTEQQRRVVQRGTRPERFEQPNRTPPTRANRSKPRHERSTS